MLRETNNVRLRNDDYLIRNDGLGRDKAALCLSRFKAYSKYKCV